jgi:hypothetical protein
MKPDLKQKSRGVGVDMSPKAITRRLKIASRMREVCLKLGKAKKVSDSASESEKK